MLKMLLRALVLIFSIIIHPALLNVDVDDLDAVIEGCNTFNNLFTEMEYQFTRKRPRGRYEPDLYEPQIRSLKPLVYAKEKDQRVFDCIADVLRTYDDTALRKNEKYQNLVGKCLSNQNFPVCDPNYPYRTLDGTCNNLKNPNQGAVLGCATRKFPAHYEGSSGFRKSVDGKDLPYPRDISKRHMNDTQSPSEYSSILFVYFGQFLAHDLSDSPVTFVEDERLECCGNVNKNIQHPQCAPIPIRVDDPHYSKHNVTCLDFVRTAMCNTCSLGPRIHMNEVTDYIDLSVVYGLTNDLGKKIRKLDGSGQLIVQNVGKAGPLLPQDHELLECFRCGEVAKCTDGVVSPATVVYKQTTDHHCFFGGDRRTNQHTLLMIFHTLFLREHNRLAENLKMLNPHWDGEKIYQEARKINIAQFQVMTYTEFLDQLLSEEYKSFFELDINEDLTRTIYDPDEDATQMTEFTTAAFRLHTMVDNRWARVGVETNDYSKYLRNSYQQSGPLYEGDLEKIIERMGRWTRQNHNRNAVIDITDYLYRERKGDFGYDLMSVNIQRGRDNGLPPYVKVLEYYEDVTINDFDDLLPYMKSSTIESLKSIYRDVRDIDLFVGMNSEKGKLSPTASKIIAEQFYKLKYGDRFYFEHSGIFTDEQLQELKKASLSRLFCDNTKLKHVPPYSMTIPLYGNPYVPCFYIPKVNLLPWKE